MGVLGPIFNREFLILPRRPRHYPTRVAFLGALWVLSVTAWLAVLGWQRSATLGDTARLGPFIFLVLAFVQLTLFLFFSALTAASAFSQEKDRRTFVLLLMTDLTDTEIVLGKLLGSLLNIGVLLLTTIPLLCLLILLGGIALYQVIEAVVLIAAASLAAGSLGGLVGLWRDRTFQSLALTVLFMVLYLCLVRILGLLPGVRDLNLLGGTVTQWLDPFAALVTVLAFRPQEQGILPPAFGFSAVMVVFSILLNLWGIVKLRVWNPSGEPIIQREVPGDTEEEEAITPKLPKEYEATANSPTPSMEEPTVGPPVEAITRQTESSQEQVQVLPSLERNKSEAQAQAQQVRESVPTEETGEQRTVHSAPGKIRTVGANPILWRETATRAYGRRPLLVKFAYLLAVLLIGYYALAPLYSSEPRVAFAAAYGLLPIGILSLLLVAAQATTAITSERDIGALDLLLVTDLTAKEFVFGKLIGICWNTKEYLLPPLILAGIYAFQFQALATPPASLPELSATRNLTAFLCVVGSSLVVLAFAMVLGIHVALRTPNSRLAIINTLGTIFFLSVGTLVCIFLILISGRFEYQWGSFVLFLVAGIGGLWWVLSGDRPSTALTLASWFCPLSVLYVVMNVLVARPGTQESADPLIPFLVIAAAFGFSIAAMLVPLVSEFDVAMGRTSGGAD